MAPRELLRDEPLRRAELLIASYCKDKVARLFDGFPFMWILTYPTDPKTLQFGVVIRVLYPFQKMFIRGKILR